ncbi:hypothetical protein BV898_02461 [Hypsibius exemplaris]|uniref:Uncharacterized protein n=1 Tax=Hypsibius exemplaris TaxID=2072580 RepID=A0A1W0X8I9_HYPEX|nr:hypothetical protein BV898_02461 [Hypsibius exemplaris]
MEKKSKSKSIFSLFSLDWDDKPKHRSDKYQQPAAASSSTKKHHESSRTSRSSDKVPPQPAPRIRSKSAKAELAVHVPSSQLQLRSTSKSSTKRHSGVMVQRTQSPFPSPHLAKKPSKTPDDVSIKDRNRNLKAIKDDQLLQQRNSPSESSRKRPDETMNPEVRYLPPNRELEDEDVEVALKKLETASTRHDRQSERQTTTRTTAYQNEEVSEISFSRDHSDSSLPTTPIIKRIADNREPPSDGNRPKTSEDVISVREPRRSEQLTHPATRAPPSGQSYQPHDTKKTQSTKEVRQSPGYNRHLLLREHGATTDLSPQVAVKVESINAVRGHAAEDGVIATSKVKRGHRWKEQRNGLPSTQSYGSTRNLTTVIGAESAGKRRMAAHDLTFETAVLSLIRLRRLEAKLRRNRDRYLQELQLFRGWDDNRHIHVLDQIAKSNRQMDELDPLIASLEEFINDQHTPPFIPEDEVLRYPVSFDQRRVFPSSFEATHQLPYNYGDPYGSAYHQRSQLQQSDLPKSFLDRKLAVLREGDSRVSRSVGRAGLHVQTSSYARPSILPNRQADASDIDRELDALTNQVRQLQLQKDSLQRNSADPQHQYPVDPEFETEKKTYASRRTVADEHLDKVTSLENERSQAPQTFTEVNMSKQFTGREFRVPSNGHVSSSIASTTSSSSTSEEVSVDEPYQYEDFTDATQYDSYLNESLTKLQNVMRDLEDDRDGSEPQPVFGTVNRYNTREMDRPSTLSSCGHPPLPPIRKTKTIASTRARRHHTISSENPSAIIAARRAYNNERYSDNEAMSDDIFPSRKSSLDDDADEAISYDYQIRLNSPDPISIPERYLDLEQEREVEDEIGLKRRKAKAEDIRRMLAVPEPGSSDRDQREREKLLRMTPILAREVTERSRRVALEAKNRSVGR